ncbi:MAG: peptidylprolyl isomerase [Parvibaculales bacterium]
MTDDTIKWHGQLWILVLAFAFLIAVIGRINPSEPQLHGSIDASAHVNGSPISSGAFALIRADMEMAKNAALTQEEQDQLLELMIDEELMIQKMLAEGFLVTDIDIRRRISNAYITQLKDIWDTKTVTAEELQTYFNDNIEEFTPSAEIHVKRIFVRGAREDVDQRINAIRQAFQSGASFEEVAVNFGDAIPPAIPAKLLPLSELKQYIGPILTQKLTNLPNGTLTDAIQAGSGWHFLYIVERTPGTPPAFETVAEQVETMYRALGFEAFLDENVAALRVGAKIRKTN